jgi:hypothetical protein
MRQPRRKGNVKNDKCEHRHWMRGLPHSISYRRGNSGAEGVVADIFLVAHGGATRVIICTLLGNFVIMERCRHAGELTPTSSADESTAPLNLYTQFSPMSQEQNRIYLNPSILQWPCYLESWSEGDESRIQRSYDTLEYAVSLIEGETSEFKMADAVMNLKRAINTRLKLLDELYRFSDASGLKKLGALERLEAVGLAKPFLIKQLFELRNDIEHNDAPSPAPGRVRELLDITWYFLRSTDPAVGSHSRTLLFESSDTVDDKSSLWLEVKECAGRPNQINVSGWLDSSVLSSQEGWEVLVESIEAPPASATGKGLTYFDDHGGRPPDHRFVVGTMSGQEGPSILLWKRMFSLI